MNYLIIGSTGNIGKNVVSKIQIENNDELIIANRTLQEESQYQQRIFDFEKEDTYDQALNEIDCLFFVRPPSLTDVELFKKFANACKTNNVKYVVFISLVGVENNPFPPHGKIEKEIIAADLDYCFLRCGFFMENLLYPHGNDIKMHDQIIIPAANAKTAFISTVDIGAVAAYVMTNFKTYPHYKIDICGDTSVTYDEVAEKMSNILNRNITYTKPGFLKYRKHMLNQGYDKGYVNVTIMLYIMTRLNTANKPNNNFEQLLGYKPLTIEQFTQQNVHHFTL